MGQILFNVVSDVLLFSVVGEQAALGLLSGSGQLAFVLVDLVLFFGDGLLTLAEAHSTFFVLLLQSSVFLLALLQFELELIEALL